MTASRQDAWTEDDDLLLAEVTLRHIREGGTQLSAFEEVGQKLNRTAAACGFRWNSLVRKKYEAAIQIAKSQRQKRSYQKPKTSSFITSVDVETSQELNFTLEDNTLSFDSIIKFLKRQKDYSKRNRNFEKEVEDKTNEIELLKKENRELKERLKVLDLEHKVVNEDYKALIQIMDRARKLAFLEEEEEPAKPVFKMDLNGNLERINK